MKFELLLFVGALAAIILGVTVRGGLTGRLDPKVGFVGGAAAFGLWGVFAYRALDVTIGLDGSTPVTEAYVELAVVGAIAALLSLVVSAKAAFEEVTA